MPVGSSHPPTLPSPGQSVGPGRIWKKLVPSYVTSNNTPVPPPHLGPPAHLAPRDHGSLPLGLRCSSPWPVTSVQSPVSHVTSTEPSTLLWAGTGVFSQVTSPPLWLMPGPRTQSLIPPSASNSRATGLQSQSLQPKLSKSHQLTCFLPGAKGRHCTWKGRLEAPYGDGQTR